MPDLTLGQLTALWSKGTFHPAYLFAGPDALQKEEALRRLQQSFLSEDSVGLNLDKFDGESADAGEVLNAVRTMPFGGGRRLVVVRRAHELAAAQLNLLADGMETFPSGNCLVLLWDEKADARSVLVQAVKSAGVVLTFWIPFEDQLPRWIAERAESLGKTLGSDAARALLESVGSHTTDLAQEVEKLALYVKDRKAIGLSDVEAFRPESRPLQFMEWERAFWKRDRAKALELLQVLRTQGQAPEALLSQMVRCFQKLFLGKTLLAEKKITQAQLWDRLWIRTRQPQQEFLQGASAYSWAELLQILEALLQAESRLKTGLLDPETGLTFLVLRLTEEAGLVSGG